MLPAALPPDEQARLQALIDLQVLDTPPEEAFDALVRAASLVCGTPIALVSLVDDRRQWFKANLGLEGTAQTPRDVAFCAHAILGDDVFEVADAGSDARFADNPLVAGDPKIRFYAGAPIELAGHERVGTLCVIDRQPRSLSAEQRAVLRELSRAAAAALQSRRDAALLARSQARFRALTDLTPIGVFETDAQGLCIYANRRWQDIFGLAGPASLGGSWLRCMAVMQREALQQAWRSAGPSNADLERDLSIERPDGEHRQIRLKTTVLRNEQGQVSSIIGTVEDVSHALALESRLNDERRYLASVIEGTSAGTWEWNIRTGAKRVNARWAGMLGYSLRELEPITTETWLALSHPSDRQRAAELLKRHFDGADERYECEFRMRHRNGHWVWVLSRGRVLTRNADGSPEWMFGTHVDCTETVEAREALTRANERLELALEGGNVGLWEYDVANNRLSWESRLLALYGLPADTQDFTYERWLDILHPDDRTWVHEEVMAVVSGARGYDIKFRVLWADGSEHLLHSSARARLSRSGRVLGLIGTTWDVSDVYNLSKELAQKHELLRVTLQSIGDAVITTDEAGRVTWLNPVAERLTGWSAPEALGQAIEDVFVIHAEDSSPAPDPVRACLQQNEVVALARNTVLASKAGEVYGIEDSAAPIRDASGRVLGAVLVFHDVTAQRRLSQEMTHRAKHDALTGLVNRQEFEARLARVLEHAQQRGTLHTLLFIDLDQFKLVNDACGHAAGDQLLKQVAQMFTGVVRHRDTLARLGGDEFAVILEQCDREQAQRVAQQLCDRMEAYRFVQEDRRFRVGASVGLVQIDAAWPDLASVMRAADAACYAAKEAGRNRVHTWLEADRSIQQRSGEMQWATRLAQALDDNRFVLFAQPISDLRAGAAGGALHAEVLVRLLDGDGSLVMPGAFLPAAERFGLAARLDRWVVTEALNWLDQRQADVELLHVNLSAQSIADPYFTRWLLESLALRSADTRQRLCFEITETVALTNLMEVAAFVDSLRELGAMVALDDFGAGASHFGYLKSLHVDMIKVDGQFIKGMLDDALDDASVRGFLEVARVLAVRTVAEFVDGDRVSERVRDLGFDFAQGYHLGRPARLSDWVPPVTSWARPS